MTPSYHIPGSSSILLAARKRPNALIGTHKMLWNGANSMGQALSSGLYYTLMVTEDGQVQTLRMTRVR